MKIPRKRPIAPKLPLAKIRLRHFKAVRDSGVVTFTPLTAFIGNNGVGKSSLIEALEAFQAIVLSGIDTAMAPWRGFEHIWNKAADHEETEDKLGHLSRRNPVCFELTGLLPAEPIIAPKPRGVEMRLSLTASKNLNDVRVSELAVGYGGQPLQPIPPLELALMGRNGTSQRDLESWVRGWQFLNLQPEAMRYPQLQSRSLGAMLLSLLTPTLQRDGSNIADYLLEFSQHDPAGFSGLVDTLRTVLPYAADFSPQVSQELERSTYLLLKEKGFDGRILGWLMSQGTLRIVALLAVLRHPTPPSVIFIEELENGLDPRTIHLVVEEIRMFVEGGRGQVVITTHSPYLLDLLHLSQIVVVERDAKGSPTFRRPATDQALKEWSKDFAPGQLYTMGKLTREGA